MSGSIKMCSQTEIDEYSIPTQDFYGDYDNPNIVKVKGYKISNKT